MDDLASNLDKLHTTPMGADRIKRNLNLQVDIVFQHLFILPQIKRL